MQSEWQELQNTETPMSSYYYCKVLIIQINQWKFEQYRGEE